MLTLSIGPLALPVAPLLALVTLLLTTWAVRRFSSAEEREAADAAVWWAAAVGLLAARAVHVGLNLEAYTPQPLTMLDIRDGGFTPTAGVVVGLVFLVWRTRGRLVHSRRTVLTTSVAAVLLWGLAGQSLQWFKPAPGQQLSEIPVLLQPLVDAAPPALPGTLQDIQRQAGGKPIVLNLWASWCGPCRAEMPVLARAQRQHPDVLFLLVNQGESEAVLRAFLQRERLQLSDVWRDPTSALGPAVGSSGLPTTVVFNAQGQRVKAHVGVLSDAALSVLLRSVQAPKP